MYMTRIIKCYIMNKSCVYIPKMCRVELAMLQVNLFNVYILLSYISPIKHYTRIEEYGLYYPCLSTSIKV